MSSFASVAGLRFISSVFSKNIFLCITDIYRYYILYNLFGLVLPVFMATFCNVPFLVAFGLTLPPSIATTVSDPCLKSV